MKLFFGFLRHINFSQTYGTLGEVESAAKIHSITACVFRIMASGALDPAECSVLQSPNDSRGSIFEVSCKEEGEENLVP